MKELSERSGDPDMSDTGLRAHDRQGAATAERQVENQRMDASGAELYARFFRVLGDPTRIRLLGLLLEAPAGEQSVGELVEALGAPQSRVSTHLSCLRWCGLVQTRREGKQVYYRVADVRIRDLLTLGGALLREHAAEVATCDVIS
jgi:DNA-binding transcriptional ArsR family regulator